MGISTKYIGVGLGYRAAHHTDIMEGRCKASWYEALTENYMGMNSSGFGPAFTRLKTLARHYPIVFHGVSMSIASAQGVKPRYIETLLALKNEIKPLWVSDHLCFTGSHEHNSHDLLPFVFDEKNLEQCYKNVDTIQQVIGEALLLENISTYIEFEDNTMQEWEFLARLQEKSSCKILLDLNNI